MHKQIRLLILIFILLNSCSGSETTENNLFGSSGDFSRETSVEVMTVEHAEISDQIRSFGTVRPQDVVSIIPQINERVLKIEADLGDTVTAGQILARLYDITYKDQLIRDQAELRQRKITLERDSIAFGRQTELFNRQLLSPSEFEQGRAVYHSSIAAYESSLASITQSKENLDRTLVRSPVNGVIKNRLVSEGDLASSGQPMFEIANLAGYEISLYLPLRDWKQTKIGQKVDIRNSNDSEFTSEGVITRKSPDIDELTGLGQIVVSISQIGEALYSGALIESRIYIETRPSTIVIPRIALIENVETVIDPESNSIMLERAYSAFVVQGDTLAQRRLLELGIQQGDRIEVLSGLETGDQLIITGQTGLEDQARVRPTSLLRNEGNERLQGIEDASTSSSLRRDRRGPGARAGSRQ
ncbi:MAG: efflux RND transporter periplasmic adaptor subunit [Balneolales bacterium]